MEAAHDDDPRRRTGAARYSRRAFIVALGLLSILTALLSFFGFYMFSAPGYRGPVSDHFDGEKFFMAGVRQGGFLSLLRWLLTRSQGKWTHRNDLRPGPPPPERVDDAKLRVTFVNHATVLIQTGGLNILTDPVWAYRVSPVSFTGPTRYKPPGIRLEDLPPIDVVLVSHNHYDHMDVATLGRIATRHAPRIFTSLGNRQYLESQGMSNVVEMDWWDTADLGSGIRLTSVPAQHFSGRGLGDRNRTLWCGFVMEGPAGPVYFAADTGVGDFFDDIAGRFPGIRLALLPIGAYEPRWFMAPVHMGPDDAVHVHLRLGAERSMAIHFGTFALADDGENEPVELLHATLGELNIPRDHFRALGNGESWEIG